MSGLVHPPKYTRYLPRVGTREELVNILGADFFWTGQQICFFFNFRCTNLHAYARAQAGLPARPAFLRSFGGSYSTPESVEPFFALARFDRFFTFSGCSSVTRLLVGAYKNCRDAPQYRAEPAHPTSDREFCEFSPLSPLSSTACDASSRHWCGQLYSHKVDDGVWFFQALLAPR